MCSECRRAGIRGRRRRPRDSWRSRPCRDRGTLMAISENRHPSSPHSPDLLLPPHLSVGVDAGEADSPASEAVGAPTSGQWCFSSVAPRWTPGTLASSCRSLTWRDKKPAQGRPQALRGRGGVVRTRTMSVIPPPATGSPPPPQSASVSHERAVATVAQPACVGPGPRAPPGRTRAPPRPAARLHGPDERSLLYAEFLDRTERRSYFTDPDGDKVHGTFQVTTPSPTPPHHTGLRH